MPNGVEIEDIIRTEMQILREMKEILAAQMEANVNNFCADGIVNHHVYLEVQPKILFVLKEVNWQANADFAENRHDWDDRLVNDLRDGARHPNFRPTWHPVAIWAKVILKPDWVWTGTADERDFQFRADWLRQIAFLNLKKTSSIEDHGIADLDEIERYAWMYPEQLKRQVKLYSPDFIVCGGRAIGNVLVDLFGDETGVWNWYQCGRTADAPQLNSFVGKSVKLIEMAHPSNRGRGTSYLQKYLDLRFLLDR